MKDIIINKLVSLNIKAKENGDVPVSCVIVRNNVIVSSAYNQRVKLKDPFAHAEIIAIRRACKKLNTYNLSDCVMYTTLYPCNMCEEVIKEAKIQKILYILDKEKEIIRKIKCEKMFVNNNYFKEELSNFFVDKR